MTHDGKIQNCIDSSNGLHFRRGVWTYVVSDQGNRKSLCWTACVIRTTPNALIWQWSGTTKFLNVLSLLPPIVFTNRPPRGNNWRDNAIVSKRWDRAHSETNRRKQTQSLSQILKIGLARFRSPRALEKRCARDLRPRGYSYETQIFRRDAFEDLNWTSIIHPSRIENGSPPATHRKSRRVYRYMQNFETSRLILHFLANPNCRTNVVSKNSCSSIRLRIRGICFCVEEQRAATLATFC